MNKQNLIYGSEVFLYTIVLTYIGSIFSTIIDNIIKKLNLIITMPNKEDKSRKVNKTDKTIKNAIKEHLLLFIQIGLIGLISFILREVVVYAEDLIIGKTYGNPEKYAIIIMGSVMFYTSDVLKDRVINMLMSYGLK